jgi:YD repeat-containing protein
MLRPWLLALFLSVSLSLLGLAPEPLAADEEYDEAGRVVRSVDENGQEARYRYDLEGQLVEVQHGDGTPIRYEVEEEPPRK